MLILASSHPLRLFHGLDPETLSTGRAILQARHDHDEKLSEAFEGLISIAQSEDDDSGSTETLMESHLFVSARSSFHSELAEAITGLDHTSFRFQDFENGENELQDTVLESDICYEPVQITVEAESGTHRV